MNPSANLDNVFLEIGISLALSEALPLPNHWIVLQSSCPEAYVQLTARYKTRWVECNLWYEAIGGGPGRDSIEMIQFIQPVRPMHEARAVIDNAIKIRRCVRGQTSGYA